MRERERSSALTRLLFLFTLTILCQPTLLLADNLILGVPNWDQPSNDGIAGYPGWCAPTSGAMVMGYWEDKLGLTGLADRQVYPGSPAYPSNANTWQQGLWHDGTIEMGWFMDTGSWRTNGGPFPPNAGGTVFTPTDNIMTGLRLYATTAWNDPDGLHKVALPSATFSSDTLLNQTMWNKYMGAINAGRPVVVTFDSWVSAPQGTTTVKGKTVNLYSLGDIGAHTVAGVGYIDPTPTQLNGDERIIAQDNWSSTPQYVAVPISSSWLQNDYAVLRRMSYHYDPSGAQPLTDQRGDPQCTKLLDGQVDATANWDNDKWVGVQVFSWPGGPVIDFDQGTQLPINRVLIDYLVDHDGGVHAPDQVAITLSNNEDFSSPLFSKVFSAFNDAPDADRRQRVGEVRLSEILFDAVPAEYARLTFLTDEPWVFLGEIEITPEPATLSLLALGGLALLRRRRRIATRSV